MLIIIKCNLNNEILFYIIRFEEVKKFDNIKGEIGIFMLFGFGEILIFIVFL